MLSHKLYDNKEQAGSVCGDGLLLIAGNLQGKVWSSADHLTASNMTAPMVPG